MCKLKVNVVGLGYIGLPTASMIADQGISVSGYDISQRVVHNVNNAVCDNSEPGLQTVLKRVTSSNLLTATTRITEANVHMIAVPTPISFDCDGTPTPDCTKVFSAISEIAPALRKNDLIIIESTCPVGTTLTVHSLLKELRSDLIHSGDLLIHIAYCPERVIPGNIMCELKHNDRIIGGLNPASAEKAKEFYKMFIEGNCHITDCNTAELCKLAENASRDVQIAFANELSMICSEFSIDASEAISLCNKHPRVNILDPGCGVGGHCIAVDPWFLVAGSPKHSQLIKTARQVNREKTIWTINKIEEKINDNSFEKVYIFGLSYKANTDDLRESPALEIYNALNAKYSNIIPVEPNITCVEGQKIKKLQDLSFNKNDLIVSLVKHDEFKSIALSDLAILDFCGLFD